MVFQRRGTSSRRKRPIQRRRSDSSSDENSSDNSSITRCVCRKTHSVGLMVQCDKCEVWQHCSCMGLEQPEIPDQYYCEKCKPDNHKTSKSSNGRTKRKYVDSARAPKRRMTLNSQEASMSLEDVLAVRNALELYEAQKNEDDGDVDVKMPDTVEEKSEPSSSTVSSVGHDESPLVKEQENYLETEKVTRPRRRQPKQVERKTNHRVNNKNKAGGNRWSRTSTPVRESSPMTPRVDIEEETTDEGFVASLFDHLSPKARASSPPARTRQPNSRMSLSEMNRRANQILEYISSIQVEMATKVNDDHGSLPAAEEDNDNDSLSSASTIPLDDFDEIIPNKNQTSLELMDILTRKLIKFQRKYGPRKQMLYQDESSRITRNRETSGAFRNMMAH